jgi:glyoxylase-like metal-dependent hydrolase (beta-lactamase superfamily II)
VNRLRLTLNYRLLRGVNGGSKSDPNPTNKRRDLALIAGLINHPTEGLILFETGCAEDVEVKWGAPITDVFPRTTYDAEHRLPAAIKAAGYDIKDIKKVIIGHLHLDHAGGLEHFIGTKSKSAGPRGGPATHVFHHSLQYEQYYMSLDTDA